MRIRAIPPAFVDNIPYVPSQKERESCHWATLFFTKCSGSVNCARCDYHPQKKSSKKGSATAENVAEIDRETGLCTKPAIK